MPMSLQNIAAPKSAYPGQFTGVTAAGPLTAFDRMSGSMTMKADDLPDSPDWGADETARDKFLPNLAFGLLLARYRAALERDFT